MATDSQNDESSRFLAAWLGARQLIQAANFNRFQREGLSATQFMTLNLLPVDGSGMTLSELALRMNLGLATLAKTVDSLQARGLVMRQRSHRDRRLVSITLTEEGKALQNAASREFHRHMAGLFRSMPAKQRAGLIAGLEGLVKSGSAGPPARPGDDDLPVKRNARRSPRP